MASPNLAERLAKLLDLPIEVIQAYCKPQMPVSFRVDREIVGTVSDVEPPYRLNTLKADAVAPPAEVEPPARYATLKEYGEVPEAEVAPPDENELYAQWLDAPEAENPELGKKLFNELIKHAERVMWRIIPDADKGLARDIVPPQLEMEKAFVR
ncbi:MAG: hypothetical protein WCB94_17710 [Terriglobales bacterium]